MAQPAAHIGRREDLFNRIVKALQEMPSDLRTVFLKTHYAQADPVRLSTERSLSEEQLAACRKVAERSFFANLEGRRLRAL